MAKPRNFEKEYREYHSKPEQIKNRAARNAARAEMVALGVAKKGDGRDVDHKNGVPTDNRRSNLRMTDTKTNRGVRAAKERGK